MAQRPGSILDEIDAALAELDDPQASAQTAAGAGDVLADIDAALAELDTLDAAPAAAEPPALRPPPVMLPMASHGAAAPPLPGGVTDPRAAAERPSPFAARPGALPPGVLDGRATPQTAPPAPGLPGGVVDPRLAAQAPGAPIGPSVNDIVAAKKDGADVSDVEATLGQATSIGRNDRTGLDRLLGRRTPPSTSPDEALRGATTIGSAAPPAPPVPTLDALANAESIGAATPANATPDETLAAATSIGAAEPSLVDKLLGLVMRDQPPPATSPDQTLTRADRIGAPGATPTGPDAALTRADTISAGPATFGQAFGRGVATTKAMGFGAAEAVAEAANAPALHEWARTGREGAQDDLQALGVRTNFTDGKFGQWAKEVIGEQIPIMGTMAAGGVAGAQIGAIGGPGGATLGALIGAFVPALGFGVGEVQGGIKTRGGPDDPEASSPAAAFVGGAAIAAFDSLLPGHIGTNLVRRFGLEAAEAVAERALTRPIREGLLVRTARGALEGVKTEGLTEALQEAIGEVAAAVGTGTPINTATLPSQMLEAGAAGALVGGVSEGIAHEPEANPAFDNLINNIRDSERARQSSNFPGAVGATAQPANAVAPPAPAAPPPAAPVTPSEPAATKQDDTADSVTSHPVAAPFDPQAAVRDLPGNESIRTHPLGSALVALGDLRGVGGLVPVSRFSPEEQAAIRAAGVREETESTEDGGSFTGFSEGQLWQLRSAYQNRPSPPAAPVTASDPADVVDQIDEALAGDSPEAAPSGERSLDDWMANLYDAAQRTGAAEKDPGRRMTEEEAQVHGQQGWEAFSRLRGYSDAEIDDYRRFLALIDEAPRVGADDGLAMEIVRTARQDLKAADAPTASQKTEAPAPAAEMSDEDLAAEIQRELEAEAADRAPAAPPPPQAAEDVTARTTAQVDADTPGYVRRYRARFGNVLNADNASELFEDYAGSPETRATRVQEVRPAAAKVVEAAYAAALAEPVPEGKQPVAVFTSGGNGSGKSSTVDPDGQQHLVFDSTLSQPAPSAAKIDQALAANHQAVIRHVSRDPVEAWDSVLARAMDEGQGRTVTVAGHDLTHSGARKTLFELADRYAGNPNVTIQVWENGKNGLTPRSVDWLRTQEYPEGDALRRQLLDRVDEALAAGRISPAVAEGARGRLGHRSDGPRDAGGVQPERQRQQGPQGEAPLAPPGPPVTARPRQTTRVRTDAVPPIYHQTIDTADGPKSVATIVAEMQAEGRSEGEIGAWVAGLRRGNAVAVGNPSPSGATVRENADRGGLEVAFEGKPSAEVRDRLKSAGFRWSRAQGLWYRKAKGDTVDDIRALIGQDTAPNTAPVVDAGPPVTPKAENPAAGDDFQPGDRVMYRGTVMTVESPAWQTDFLQLDDGRNGKSRVIRAVVPKAVVRLSAEEAPQKKPKTPQVPNDPDTKYVLPTFATGRGPLRTDTKPGRTTPAAESPGFAVGDRVRADEGSGEVVRLSESGESVKIALDDGGALTKWISVSRVTPLDAGKAGPPVTPSDRIEFEVKSLQTGETSTLTVPTDLPVTPKADKARLVPKRTDGGGVQWVAEPIVPEATADPKAAKRAALAKKRAEARGEIDAAVKGIRDALKDQGNTLSAGLPIPPPDLILQTVKLVRAFAKAGIVELEDGWLSFQDEFGAGYEQVRGAFVKAWSKVHGVAEAAVRADLAAIDSAVGEAPEGVGSEQEASHGPGDRNPRPGAVPERDGGAAGAVGTGRPDALAEVSADAVPATASAGAERPGDGRAEGVVPERVPDRPDAGAAAEPASHPGGGDVPGSALAPTGAVRDPGPARPDYSLTPERVAAIIGRGAMTRARDNVAAIRLIKEIMAERRHATEAEQEVLAKYVGWGSGDLAPFLAEEPRRSWKATERTVWDEVRSLTTPEERDALRRSTSNAHFTYDLYRPIWAVLERAGFLGGRVLEPSVGTGHAFGFMPPALRQASVLSASELDPMTAAIAQALYPSAKVQAVGYQEARIPTGTQDLVISNVPFGDFGVQDDRMPSFLTERVHNYFFARALEHVRPGGYIVFVTSRFTMDGAKATKVREHLMRGAHFIGAVRLPNSAFDKSARTEVVTDLIVLQRFAEGETTARNADAFIKIAPVDELAIRRDGRGKPKVEPFYRSTWYTEHPEYILGNETRTGSMYGGNEYTVEGTTGKVTEALEEALGTILPPGSYESATTAATRPDAPAVVEGAFKTGEFRIQDGQVMRVDRDGNLQPATPMRKVDGKAVVDTAAVKRIAGMVQVRDRLRDLRATMMNPDATDAAVTKGQQALKKAYDTFVKAHKHLNHTTNKRVFRADPEAENLLALEKLKATSRVVETKKGPVLRVSYELVGLSDIFTKRTIRAGADITHVDTAQDALLASLGTRTSLDWRFMASVTGDHTVTDERIAALREALAASGRVFEQPDGSWVLAEEYLSGDVVTKLADAELAAADAPGRFDRNLAALREIVPEHKAISQIAPTLGANWIPPEFIGHFVADLLGVETPFRGLELDSTQAIVRWRVAFDYDAIRAGKEHELAVPYGQLLDEKTGKKSHLAGVTDLIEAALNLESPTLGHTIDVGDSKKFIRDEDATLAARANIEELRERFMEWVQSTPEAAETIAGIYNTRFNRNVARRFDGSHLAAYDAEGNRTAALPGLSLPFQLFPHQLRAIWRILTSGNTLLAHEVGAGKTFEMIAAAMEMRRTGRARKPMITVPTHLLGSWRADILKAYPAAKVLAFDEQDLAAGKRKEAMARIAYGDWDIVLVPQSSFGLLKVSPARMIKTMEAMVDELVALIVANKGDVSVKKFERIKRKLEDKIAKKLAAVKKGDDALYWEELGVDALLVDEAHNFKNLFFFTELENIRGLSRSEADKSLDLFIKIQDINQASNHRNVVLATATPVMNSIAELYTMQRYLQPQTLETQGFSAFDNWYRTFGHAAPNVEQRPDGTYHEVMRLKKFRNLDLLYRTVSDVMDYVGWDDMPYLDLPKLAGGRVEVVETPPHPMYPKVKAWFADRLAALRETPPHVDREGNYIAPERMHPLTGKPLGRKDNILAVMNDAKLAAIDVRLVLGGGVKDFPESRIQTAAKLMAETYKREKARKGVLLAFLDVGTPKGTDLEPLEFLRGATVEDETAGGALGTEDVEGDDDLDLGETGDFNLYGALKAALVKRGIPPAEIAFIHQARNAAERLALFDALNAGTVRVLVASSEKGGTGMNIQQRLAETLHIDAPRFMRPGDLRQREGRMIRQGNSYKEVTLRRFITPGTTDEWLYGLLMSKQSAISEFMRGNLTEYTEEDPSSISIEEAQARSANDPRVVELTTLRGQIKRLEAQASAAQRATAAARETLATAPLALAAAQKKLTAIEAWKKASFKSLRGSDFEITVGDQTYTKRADANTALIQALKEMLDEAPLTPERPYSSSKRSPVAYVGTVRGLPLMAYVTEWVGDRKVVLSLDTSSVAGGGHHTQPVAEVSDLSADGTPFGEGRDLVASVVSDYDGLGTLGGWTQREIDDLEATIARARKIVDTPSDVIEKAIRARARIGEIEAALKAEGEERDKQADADRKLRKAEEERRKKEADLAAAQAAEDDDDAGSGPLAMAAGPPVTPRPQGATARTGGAPPVTPRQRPSDIVKQLRRALGGLPIRERHFRHRAVGIYKPDVHEIRVKVANDLPTIFHEAGHGLDISVLKISRRDARWRDELYALGEATSRPSYTPGQVRKEGAAEFFRLYLMQPSKAEASAPAYFKEFEARLAEHADLRTLLLETRQNIHDYMAQDPATRLRLRIDSTGQGAARGAKQLLTDPKGWLRRQAIHWVDDLKPIRDAVEAMRDDRELDFRHNAYALARLARGAAGKAQGFLEHGVRGRNGRFLSGALADALKPVAAHLDDFVDYLVALRTLELHDTSKRPRAIETGVSVEEARAMIAQVKARPDLETFDQARRAVYAYQDATLEYARQFGALSADQIAKMKALNENYVPFKRVMDDVEASWSGVSRKLANRSVPIRRIKGSGRDIINPLESIIVNTHVLVDMVEKNRAMLALVNQANASVGSARWLTKIPPPQIPTTVNVLDVLGGAVGPRDPSVADFINASGVTEQDMVTMFSPAFMGKPGEQVVTVIRGGKREFYQVNDPDLYQAITRVGPQLKDSMLAAAAEPFTRLLRAGATLTPEFIVRNPGRDTLVAFLQSRYGFIPGVDTVRGLLGLILNDADAKLYFTSGIDQAALVGQDRNRVRQERDKLTREGHAQLAKYFVRNPLELLRALSSQMENATRLGEFKLALEAGGVERGVLKRLFGPSDRVVTEEALTRATLAARDVTTDFSRGGDWSREANRYSAFFNARVQGYVRLGETVARDPIGTLEHVAGLATLSALLWFWNNDDDEYQELPEWERRTYWHIKIPGAAYFIRVPKPFEWGYLPDLVEGALEWSKTRDASAWRVVKPADGAMVQTLVSLMPTAILPMLEAYTNYSTFRERNIVSTWDLNLPAEDQYSDFTSETAKGLGKLIGVSPAKLDHIIYGYTAGLGRQAVSTADDALGALGILPKKSEKPARLFDEIPVVGKVPVVGAVAGNVARVFAREHNFTGSSVSIADFYDAYDEMTGVERSIRRKLANNETAAAKALADAHRDEWGAFERDGRAMHFTGRQAALLREGRKAMTDLGDEIDLIFKAPADKMDPQQKRAAQNLVRAKMVDIARKALGRPGLAQFQAPPR